MKKAFISLLSAVMILTTVPVTAAAQSDKTYIDISDTWYTQAVETYGYSDIFSDGSSHFHPGMKITRMNFVRLLHKALGITITYFAPIDISDSFDDMDNSEVGVNELTDLVTAGIVDSGGSFSPDKQLDRDVMIHWIITALDYMTGGNYAMIEIYPMPFNDDTMINPDYKADVVKSVVLKLINGRGNNMLFPKDGTTRAESVTVVSRLVTVLKELRADVDITASAYIVDDALVMSLTIQNNSPSAVTIHHTSGQRFDFQLFDASGETLYTWSMNKLFTQATGETIMESGEHVMYTDTLESDMFSAMSSDVVVMRAFITGTSADFTIDPNGYAAYPETVN